MYSLQSTENAREESRGDWVRDILEYRATECIWHDVSTIVCYV